MAYLLNTVFLLCIFIALSDGFARRGKFIMDERYVCVVKTSCIDCLRLSHCSWCPTEKKCFSRKLKEFDGFCSNNTINHEEFGLSLQDNAECACNRDEVQQRCYPPNVTSGPVCSGRGSCVCGQCVCNPLPDPKEPTKMVMGEFCEFDNFSCEGPKCNEGPYSISGPTIVEDGSKTLEVDMPTA